MSSRTIRRYLADEDFRTALALERKSAFEVAAGSLQDLVAQAVGVLADVMGDEDVAPSVRVKAANSVLDHAQSCRERELRESPEDIEVILSWDN